MIKSPLVSIVTPSYNQAQFLEKTIQSVLNQKYPNLEYIIIDGGSTDGSVEIIRKFENDLSAWISEPDQGQAHAINKGFHLAKGEILAWINSDDVYHPRAVEQAVSFLLENPRVGMVFGDTELINESDQVIGQYKARQTNYRRLMQGYSDIPQPAAFWRAELWRQVGPLDTSLYFAMDYDLWVRFSKVTEIGYNPKLWAGFRMHQHSKSTTVFDRCWPEMRKVHKREGGRLISVFMRRYLLRKLFSPTRNWVKRFLFEKQIDDK